MKKNIYFYETNTPIGKIGIATTQNDSHITDLIWELDFEDFKKHNNFKICETELIKQAKKQLFEYFERKRKNFNLPLLKEGTPFQISVWNALEKIPYGETRSYKDIAIAIDNPKAVRAVGMANNRNKIAIFIPCHRVIGADGKLVGYGGGLHIKRFLLELEGVQIRKGVKSMITVSINANPDIENKINNYVKENNINLNQVMLDLILEKIEDEEDYKLAVEAYEEYKTNKEKAISFDDLVKKMGLEDEI